MASLFVELNLKGTSATEDKKAIKGHNLPDVKYFDTDFYLLAWDNTFVSVLFSFLTTLTEEKKKDIKWLADQVSCGVHKSRPLAVCLSLLLCGRKVFVNCNAVSVNYEYWNIRVLVWAQLSVTAEISNPCHYKACMKLFVKKQLRAQCK